MNHCPKTQTYWTPSCPECDCEHANEPAAAQEAGKEPGRASGDMPASAADLLKLCDEIEALKTTADSMLFASLMALQSDSTIERREICQTMRAAQHAIAAYSIILAAARQNVRRGELLRRVSNGDSLRIGSALRRDIVKEIK